MGKVFKNGPSKIYGRQPFKSLKRYSLPQQTISLQIFSRLSSTNFTWSILEYFAQNVTNRGTALQKNLQNYLGEFNMFLAKRKVNFLQS